MDIIAYLPLIFRLINVAMQVQQAMQSGISLQKAVENNAGDLVGVLSQVGKQMFPGVGDQQAAVAAASAMFVPDRVKWIQVGLNALGQTPPLDVDGDYGPLTKQAVRDFQSKTGIAVDGWAGDVTAAALQQAVMKVRR